MTLRAIDSFNRQTYPNIEKILVNGNNPPHQTDTLIKFGANLHDWKIIDFPVDSMTLDPEGQISHHLTGQAALLNSTGDYFFSMNDDDFISENYFENFSKLFMAYPSAISGMALIAPFYHDSEKFGPIVYPFDKNGKPRPTIESGLVLIKKIFGDRFQNYQMTLGVQPIFKKEFALEVASYLFGPGGFPDTSSYFQVVARGDAVFSYESIFYWGRHSKRQSMSYTDKHYWTGICQRDFETFSRVNCYIFDKFFPNHDMEKKMIQTHFKRQLIESSILAVYRWFNSLIRIPRESRFLESTNLTYSEMTHKNFPLAQHLKICLSNPHLLVKSLYFILQVKLHNINQSAHVS
jgi:glycosyltransferase involved in cell wall biosynthesis